jgi:uncharacterized protein YeaC (DUF1315 family)
MEDKLAKLNEVSEGLRKALEEGLWPGGRRRARGVEPDGTEYHAAALHGLVSIKALPHGPQSIAIPEPDGVVWQPMRTEEKPVKLDETSSGLRKALEEGRWPDGRRRAEGVGPDGTRYDASLNEGLVFIREHNEFALITCLIAEPDSVLWRPRRPDPKPVKLQEVREGLRNALQQAQWPDGRWLAVGVGPDGMKYDAFRRDDLVVIEEEQPAGVMTPLRVSEPEDVVWRPLLPVQKPVLLDEVSGRLRKALEEGRWPDGRHLAWGVGPDGTEYDASLAWDHASLRRVVFIYEIIAGTPLGIPLPEPEGVTWRPPLTDKDLIKLEAVSEGLRTALEEGRSPDGKRRSAIGVGPDGMKYCASVVHDDLVFIDFADDRVFKGIAFVDNRPFARERIPIAEPAGVVWQPYFDPVPPARRRPWWQFWK